jgi:hypothetical protein
MRVRALKLPIAIATFVLLWWWATQLGPRGSDQFWYSGYVDQFFMNGRPSTNYVTAFAWTAPFPPPPVHHIPALYPAIAFGRLGLTSFDAWSLTNLAFIFTGLAFLYAAVWRVSEIADLVVSMALFLPITFWIAANPLAEASLFCFGGFVAYGFALRRAGAEQSGTAWVVAGIALQSLTRPNHTLLLIGMLTYLILFSTKSSYRWTVGLLGAVAIGAVAFRGSLFPQYPMGGVSSLLMMGAPNVPGSNMLPFLATHDVPFDLRGFAIKVLNSVSQICPTSLYDLLIAAPIILMLVAIGFRWRRTHVSDRRDQIAYLVLSVITIAATAIIYQYQPRYWSAFCLPIVAFASHGIPVNRVASKAICVTLVVAGLVVAGLANRVRQDGRIAAAQCDSIRCYANAHSLDGGAVLILDEIDQKWSYSLPTSRILVSSTSLQTSAEILTAIRHFDVKLVVSPVSAVEAAVIAEQMEMTQLPTLVFGNNTSAEYLVWRPRGSYSTPKP